MNIFEVILSILFMGLMLLIGLIITGDMISRKNYNKNKTMRTTNTHIYFWGSFLSNWIPSNLSIEFDNNIFTNSEQIFMYLKAKYFKDEETAEEIIKLGTEPKIAKDLGRKVKNYNEKAWNNVREEMMYRAVLAKFNSDKTLHDKLIKTENKILVEGTPFDPIWGVKIRWDDDRILDEKNWEGQNLLGKVLMKVRETLKQIYK